MMPGCYDALSAKMLAHAGHKAAFVSGYAVSRTRWDLARADTDNLSDPSCVNNARQL